MKKSSCLKPEGLDYSYLVDIDLRPETAQPGGHMFYIGLYRENVKKSSCLKPRDQEPCYLVLSITKWTSTKFVQIMPLGSKKIPPRGHMFYIGLYREDKKKAFFSETTKPRALVFDM